MSTVRRPVAVLLTLGLLLLGTLTLTVGSAAATIGPTTTCNNALGNGGAVCEVTVHNTFTALGGSAVVTVRECQGSAGVPDATCTNTTTPLSQPVTQVTQCDGSINGGGGTLRCSVVVINDFVGFSPALTAVTGQSVRRFGRHGIGDDVPPLPGDNDRRVDHPVQRLVEWRRIVAHLHRDRDRVVGPPRHDQPVQRLGERRGNPDGLLGERHQPGRRRAGATPTPGHADANTDTHPHPNGTPTPTPTPTATPGATVAPTPTSTPVRPTQRPHLTAPPTDAQVPTGASTPGSSLLLLVGILGIAFVGVIARAVRGANRLR